MEAILIANELRDVVSRIIIQVNLATKQGLLDENLTLEDAMIPILKEIYQLPNLINLNAKQKNYPGIDLGDEVDRIAFQVTSTTSLEKVKKTLKIFIEQKFESNFDELYILTLSEKQKSYSQEAIDNITQDKFKFCTKKHIIDLSDLLSMISSMRLTAQKRMLHEFKLILGDVDSYLQFINTEQPQQKIIITNIAPIKFPENIYVSEVIIDFKDTLKRAKTELAFKGKYDNRTLIKLAMVLNGRQFDGWTFHEGKLFTFINPENNDCLNKIIDIGSIEQLKATDLIHNEFSEYQNIFKELLKNSLKEEFKTVRLNYHNKEKCFYFLPLNENDLTRQQEWIGKKKATRTVFEKKMNSKVPDKLLYFKHLSFEISFSEIQNEWFCLIVPSWLYTYNCYKKSYNHEKYLKQQKRLDNSGTVRNLIRFIIYFLSDELSKMNSAFSILNLVQLECEYPDMDIIEDNEENNDDED